MLLRACDVMWHKQVFFFFMIAGEKIAKHISGHTRGLARAHRMHDVKQVAVMTETLTHHTQDNYTRPWVFTSLCVCVCTVCGHVLQSMHVSASPPPSVRPSVPMPSPVNVNPHLLGERQSRKQDTPPSPPCPICTVDPS